MNRLEFIKKSGALCLGCLGGSTMLTGCKSFYYAPSNVVGNQIEVKKSEFLEHKFVLVRTIKFEEAIYLVKLGEEEYSAVLLHCTHKGCEVDPAGDYLVCPCHGSEYTNTGKVVGGPAERDLQRFKVNMDGGNVYIQV
jgi:cytochrome b6-f complex iron-sulfur subunit